MAIDKDHPQHSTLLLDFFNCLCLNVNFYVQVKTIWVWHRLQGSKEMRGGIGGGGMSGL